MVGRKTEGNFTSFAASVIQQVSSPLNQCCDELSSDILDIMVEENIEISTMPSQAATPVPALSPIESCASSSRDTIVYSCPSRSHSYTPSDVNEARSRSITPTILLSKKAETSQDQLLDIEREKMAWIKSITQNHSDDDAEKNFLLSLLSQLKSLPSQKMSEVKLNMITILHEAAFGVTP